MERDEDGGGSEQPSSSSDVGQSFLALRKMIEPMVLNIVRGMIEPMILNIVRGMIEPMVLNIVRGALKPMVISTVHEVIEPVAEVVLRKVVKEEIQLVEEKLSGGTRNDLPEERNLQLKFLDKVSGTVQTGNELKGVEDECLKLALCDTSGHIVTYGPESSARVEIVLLDASGEVDENNMTNENFETRIIRTGDKEKPHFVNSVSIKLDKGVGNLIGLKLGHDSGWTKSWKCMLGARMQNSRGIIVQEAWTAPFTVKDKRSTQYEKDVCPSPSSQVWKLKEIGRDGNPFRRLKGKNISTVLDFLFWLSVNRKELQEILGAGESRWEIIVAHAETCIIDDKKLYSHKSSTEPQMCVIYDAVGKLQGVIDESHFVPINNLSGEKKDHADELLMSVLESPSAFVERYKTFFNDKASLLQQFPSRSSGTVASSNSNIQQSLNGSDLPTLSENINRYWTTEPGLSSQSIIRSNIIDTGLFDSLGSRDMAPGPFLDPENVGGDIPTDPDYERPFDDMDHVRQNLSGGGKQINAGTSEMVRESSSRRLDTSFPSTSSTMNSFAEIGVLDSGTSISATDLFDDIKDDADTRHNRAYQRSPDSLFEGIHTYEQQYCGVFVEPWAVSTRYAPNGWNFLLCALKWWFSVRRVRRVTRKRKR